MLPTVRGLGGQAFGRLLWAQGLEEGINPSDRSLQSFLKDSLHFF